MAIHFKSGIKSDQNIESGNELSGTTLKISNSATIDNDTKTKTLTFKEYVYTTLEGRETSQLNEMLNDIVARISSITTNTIQTINTNITNLQNQVGTVTTSGETTTRTGLEEKVFDNEQNISALSSTIGTLSSTVGNANSGLVKKVNDLESKMTTMGFKSGYIIMGRLHDGTEKDKTDVIGYVAKLGTLVYGYIKDGGTLGNYLSVDSINIYKKDSSVLEGDFPGLSLAGAEVPGPTNSSYAINWLGNNGSKSFSVRGFSFGRNSDGGLKISFQSGTGENFKDSDIANKTHWTYFAYDNSGNFDPSKNAPTKKELEATITITSSDFIVDYINHIIIINNITQWKPFPSQIIEVIAETKGSYILPTPHQVSNADKAIVLPVDYNKLPSDSDSEITIKYKYTTYD